MRSIKIFEISSKKKNGRRNFKLILHKIHDDSCVDEVNKVGTDYNLNGITWLKEYCENALPTIKGMSLRVAFVDSDRVEVSNHGDTDICEGEPIYEDASMIGVFTKGYIDEIETEEGTITACIGEGYIDSSCYHNLTMKLDEDAQNGIYPNCSVEIMRTDDNDAIVYKYGYVDKGRIPKLYKYSGCAILSCETQAADNNAKLIELNNKNKEEKHTMNDVEIKALVEQTVATMTNHISEINACKKECDEKVEELNKCLDKEKVEKNEIIASSEKIQSALDECRGELEEAYKKIDALHNELHELQEALGKAKAKERIGELNSAISNFTDAEKEYAKAEIEAFNAEPVTSEINSVVNKIWEGIGKKAKEEAVIAEQNSAKETASIEDIFCAMDTKASIDTDTNIF